jgi:hypothetical protein
VAWIRACGDGLTTTGLRGCSRRSHERAGIVVNELDLGNDPANASVEWKDVRQAAGMGVALVVERDHRREGTYARDQPSSSANS